MADGIGSRSGSCIDMIEAAVGALELSAERGDCEIFRVQIASLDWADAIKAEMDDPGSVAGQRLRAAVETNRASEILDGIYGTGAALRLDHPFTAKLMRYGRISAERIVAARRRSAAESITA